jgi:cytochrome c553
MSTNKKPLPAEPQDNAANNGVAAELSDEAIRNLTGFFDVLIQMDFAQKQRNERNDEDGNDLQDTASVAA